MSMPVGQTRDAAAAVHAVSRAGLLELAARLAALAVVSDDERVGVGQRRLQAPVGADDEAGLLAEPGEVEVHEGGDAEHPAERGRMLGRAGPHHGEQPRQRDEVADEDVRHRQGEEREDRMLERLARQHPGAHPAGVAAPPGGRRSLDPALDAAEHALQEHGLRTGVAAPDAAEQRGRGDEQEPGAGQQEEQEPGVLRVEGGAEQVEPPVLEVEEDRRVAADADPGERGVDRDEHREADRAQAGEAAAHVGRMDRLALAVAPDRSAQLAGRRCAGAHLTATRVRRPPRPPVGARPAVPTSAGGAAASPPAAACRAGCCRAP